MIKKYSVNISKIRKPILKHLPYFPNCFPYPTRSGVCKLALLETLTLCRSTWISCMNSMKQIGKYLSI